MPTKKPSTKTAKKSATARKKSAAAKGAVPPYGVPIREAIARGNPSEMKAVAASARKYLTSVQSALDALEKSLTTKR